METTMIRKKLAEYVKVADEKKLKAIFTMVEDEINTDANDWDEELINELKRRSKSFANASAKTYSWEETKAAAVKKVKEKRK